jgi:GNAT superfamily N-acetyltransferase
MASCTRAAQKTDIPALVELMAEFYGESGYPLPVAAATQSFSTILADAKLGRVFIVDIDDAPAGYIVITFGFSMEYGGLQAFIDDFFVKPMARGHGLGAAALQLVRGVCSDLGIRTLLVETDSESQSARRFYQKAGFEPTGRLLLSLPLATRIHEC